MDFQERSLKGEVKGRAVMEKQSHLRSGHAGEAGFCRAESCGLFKRGLVGKRRPAYDPSDSENGPVYDPFFGPDNRMPDLSRANSSLILPLLFETHLYRDTKEHGPTLLA